MTQHEIIGAVLLLGMLIGAVLTVFTMVALRVIPEGAKDWKIHKDDNGGSTS